MLSDAQQWFLRIGQLHPLGLMPYQPDDHPIATELNDLGFIEYNHIKHRRMLSAKEAEQMKVRQKMYNCTSFGYFMTDAGRAALNEVPEDQP